MVSYNHELYSVLANEGFTRAEMFTDSPLRSNLYYVSAFVNGVEATFFIDTGAKATRLCKSFYQRVQVATNLVDTNQEAHDELCDSCEQHHFTDAGTVLTVGDISVPFFGILVMDLDFQNSQRENDGFLRVDGVIGSDVLRLSHAIIDVIAMSLFIKAPSTDIPINKEIIHEYISARGPNQGFNAVAMCMDSGWLISDAQINDVRGRFIVDTGANLTMICRNLKDKFAMTTMPSKSHARQMDQVQQYSYSATDVSIQVGNTIFLGCRPGFLNIDPINESLENDGFERVDGILSTDILCFSVICFNNMHLYFINFE
jgi:hypothetical protein